MALLRCIPVILGVITSIGSTIQINPVRQAPSVIVNANFGSALIPMEKLINSGSIWHHSFQIENLFWDPIPLNVRKSANLIYQGCTSIAETVAAITKDTDSNGDLTEIVDFTNVLCNEVLQVTETFNEQKRVLIKEIDENMKNIRHIAYSRPDLRTGMSSRAKRAPFEFISIAGEKLFGLGRKKNIKILERNFHLLREQQHYQYNQLVGNVNDLYSVNVLQNQAIGNVSIELEEQNEEIKELSQVLNRTQEITELFTTKTITKIGYLYNLITHQAALQAQMTKATSAILNTLILLRIKTGELRNAMQKISSGILPNELVTSMLLEETLEALDEKLLRKRSQFRIAMRDLNYYYAMPITSFGYNGQVIIQIIIPLTTTGGEFQNYQIQTFQLPVLTDGQEDQKYRYSQILKYPPYFAMSRDGEYYLELSEQDLSWCKGLEKSPKICSPVKFMYSVRTRPSCGLALYTGNSTMMKYLCHKEYQETKEPQSQVYQIGTTSELLITSTEGQLIKHCQDGAQMIEIPACPLCIISLPCGCILHSHQGQLPPIMHNCRDNNSTQTVRYPVNLMVLGEMLNDTQLGTYNGSVTFNKQPTYHLPRINLKRVNDHRIVALKETSFALSKVAKLAQRGEKMYASADAYVNEPQTLMEEIIKNEYTGIIQLLLFAMNGIGTIIAVMGYKKGCASAVTAAMALERAGQKGQALTIPPIFFTPSPENKIHEGIKDVWRDLQPIALAFTFVLILKLVSKLAKILYRYLSTKLIVTPIDECFDGSTSNDLTNIYLQVTNGQRTVNIFVYTLQATESAIKLIQYNYSKMTFYGLSRWPRKIFSYTVRFSSNVCLLEIGNEGQCVRFPDNLLIPITLISRFKQITSTRYTTQVLAGRNIYRELTPNFISNNITNIPEIKQVDLESTRTSITEDPTQNNQPTDIIKDDNKVTTRI